MRRLTIDQEVTVDLDSAEEAVDCAVESVNGGAAALRMLRLPDPETLRDLAGGSPGYLVFTHRGAVVALRGFAGFLPGQAVIEFRVTDGIQLPERRAGGRIAIVTVATLTHPPPGVGADQAGAAVAVAPGAIETTTVDISVTGVLVKRPPGLASIPPRLAIDLSFGEDPTAVHAVATFARATDAGVAFQFTEMSAADRKRLEEFLAGHRISSRIEQSRLGAATRS